jgi:hypothetical protein
MPSSSTEVRHPHSSYAAERFARVWTALTQMAKLRGGTIAVRAAVVLVALAILYLRMPGTFTNPQFWGEDIYFFDESRFRGWAIVANVPTGYLLVVQALVAVFAAHFDPVAAPTIFNCAAILLALLVVWMVTSPRLDMPYKPLLAIAVVIVPMGYEELGTLVNSQWILPIGAVALMFMSAPTSAVVLAGEAVFVALTALSGPFAIFLAPMFAWRAITMRDATARRRFLLLAAITCPGAIIDVLVIALNPDILNSIAPAAYSWTLWVNLPFGQFMTTFGTASELFQGVAGVILGAVLLAVAVALACQPPYRSQKLFMLFFALVIALSGMYKFRVALGTQTQFTSQRYFYPGAVFALWFICCLTDRRYLRTALAGFVVLTELMLLPVIANTPRFADDLEWPVWASYFWSGLPIMVPTAPASFFLSSPATPDGPLARFAPWIGHNIAELAGQTDPSSCTGAMGDVEPLPVFFVQQSLPDKAPRPAWISQKSAWDAEHSPANVLPGQAWISKGTAWDTARNRPVQLIALVDAAGRVIGFGLPGFRNRDEPNLAASRSGWISVFYANPGNTARAYGVVDDGRRICPLANRHYFPLLARALASDQFAAGAEIQPGKVVVQRFKPKQRLEGASLQLVTWGRSPSRYTIDWRIEAISNGGRLELGAGKIDAGTVRDWQRVKLPISVVSDQVPDEIEVSFRTDANIIPAAPVGLPLYKPAADTIAPPAEVGGAATPSGGLIGLSLAYAQ